MYGEDRLLQTTMLFHATLLFLRRGHVFRGVLNTPAISSNRNEALSATARPAEHTVTCLISAPLQSFPLLNFANMCLRRGNASRNRRRAEREKTLIWNL